MTRKKVLAGIVVLAAAAGLAACSNRIADSGAGPKPVLPQDFDFKKPRSPGTQYFDMVTMFTEISLDGTPGNTTSFHVKLSCDSKGDAAKSGDEYTCRRFVYVKPGGARIGLPTLDGWRHTFWKTKTGYDEQGRVLGIDHAKFQGLAEEDGTPLPPDKAYMIYNTFVDFHAFCDEFATPVLEGRGIQDLTRIGQRIVHAAANTTPPTNLDGIIKEGSHFKNGEVTLELKGVSVVDDAACAVVAFDSGASSFRMRMEPMKGMEVKTKGGSRYFGDIYIDLASLWPRKVEMRELIVSETNVPMPRGAQPMKINSIIERQTTIKAVTKEAYEAEF